MDVREILEVLASARDLLAEKSRWSPVHIATDDNGRWVPVGHGGATRFNLQGAVIRAAGYRARDAMKATESALRACSSEVFARTLNSPRPMMHGDALAWLDAAIAALAAHMATGVPPTAQSGSSGLMLRVSPEDAVARQTTGTDGDEE